MIHISNNGYLNSAPAAGNPLIGYKTILDITTVSADSSPEETPAVNVINEQTNQFWKSDSLAEQRFYLINTDNASVDYIAIAKHNFGTGGIEWILQGSNESDSDGPIWEDINESAIPVNDNAIMVYFDTTSYDQYSILMTPVATLPQMAHVKLGEILVMERCIKAPHKSITLSRVSKVISNTSENGAFLGRILVNQYLETDYDFRNITPIFYRDHVDEFSIHAVTGAFFIAWKPLAYPNEIAYGWAKSDICFVADNDNGMGNVQINVKAVP